MACRRKRRKARNAGMHGVCSCGYVGDIEGEIGMVNHVEDVGCNASPCRLARGTEIWLE